MANQGGEDVPPGDDPMYVNVLIGFERNEDGSEGDPVYERHRLNRPSNYRFEEPLDLSEPEPERGPLRPEHQKYQSERERLRSFDGKWLSSYHVNKEDLAKNGFIYKGPSDLVLCVYCLKSIRNWKQQDTVQGEHKRLCPYCPWVRGKVSHLNIPISEAERAKQDIGVLKKGLPLNTDMQTTASRMKTFSRWPPREIGPAVLVEAGFFYDEDNQVLTCYHCGMKLVGWDVNNIFRKHAEGYPNCPMVSRLHQSNGEHNFPTEVAIAASANNASHAGGANNIDVYMNSVAVQAVVELREYEMDEIRRAVEMLNLSKGPEQIKASDIMEKLDENRDGNMDF